MVEPKIGDWVIFTGKIPDPRYKKGAIGIIERICIISGATIFDVMWKTEISLSSYTKKNMSADFIKEKVSIITNKELIAILYD